MSGCHPTELRCPHGRVTDCYKCYVESLEDLRNVYLNEMGKKIKSIESSYVSADILFQMRQTIETWQSGCEVQINTLMKCNKELEKQIHETRIQFINQSVKEEDAIHAKYAERIGHLGKALHCLSEENEKLRKIEKTVFELVDKIEEIGNYYYKEKKQPYKCPVCDGKGFHWPENCVKNDCNPCEGKGIVWG